MNNEEIKKEVLKLKWDKWLERPFQAFILSLFEDASRKENFQELGINDVELKAQLFQHGFWYINDESFNEMDKKIEKYLDNHSIFDITSSLEKLREKSLVKIKNLIKSKIPVEKKLSEVYSLLKNCVGYIWLAHGLEAYYNRKLKEVVPKYVKADIDKFIGDASFPKKKNAHALMEEMLLKGISADNIIEKFGWIKIRDAFSEPFSVEEIENMRKGVKKHEKHVYPKIPAKLKDLFDNVQELVFFRTARTDLFYELIYASRPIFREIAEKYKISFSDLRYYRAKKLIEGKLEKYNSQMSFAYLNGKVLFQNDVILKDIEENLQSEIKGKVAYPGKIKGIVRIVKNVAEISKVEKGDILVTQMTFPSFIPAMMKACSFVTDEGGITCHAAIVAREMKKPCVIGTRNATKVLKDGDEIEVDADKGIVKILKKA